MSLHYIEYDGKYYVYIHDGRGHRVRVGLGWTTPREAISYADRLDTPYVEPLRSSGEGSPSSSPLPLDGGDAEPSPDAPRGRRRRRRAP